MAAFTPKHTLPYMQGTDLAANIDTGFEDLATAIDGAIVTYTSGATGGYPGTAAAYEGSLYFDEDTQTLYYAGVDIEVGTPAWLPVGLAAGKPRVVQLYRTSNLTVPVGTIDIEWHAALVDTGQFWSASPDPEKITLQHDGLYRVQAQAKTTSAVERVLEIEDAATGFAIPNTVYATNGSTLASWGLDQVIEASSGDQIKIACIGGTGSPDLVSSALGCNVTYLGRAT